MRAALLCMRRGVIKDGIRAPRMLRVDLLILNTLSVPSSETAKQFFLNMTVGRPLIEAPHTQYTH